MLSELSSSQLAQLVQSSGASNDTDLIDRVFEQLEDGNALENVDEFLTQLTANGKVGCSSKLGKKDTPGFTTDRCQDSDMYLNFYDN